MVELKLELKLKYSLCCFFLLILSVQGFSFLKACCFVNSHHYVHALNCCSACAFSKVVETACYCDALIVSADKNLHIVCPCQSVCRNKIVLQNSFTKKIRSFFIKIPLCLFFGLCVKILADIIT